MRNDPNTIPEKAGAQKENGSRKRVQKRLWTRDFVLISLVYFTTFVGFNMTTTGMPIYVSTLGASDSIVGLVASLTTGAALLIRPFSGILLNRFGRKGVLLVGIISMAIITAAYAVFPIIGFILALRILHGVGWGLGSTATSTIAADVIPRERFTEGMGYVALMTSLSVAVAPALSIALIQGTGPLFMFAVAITSTLISLFLALFYRPKTRTDPHSSKRKSRQDVETIPDNDAQPVTSSQTSSVENKPKKRFKVSDFFEKQALLPAAMIFFVNSAFGSVITFVALHGQNQGVDNIFLYFTVYAVVNILTRPLIGKIIDRTSVFIPGVLALICVVVTLVIIAFSDTIVMFCIAGVFASLGLGTAMGVFQTMAVASASPERRAVATSTYLFGVDAGSATGAAVAGLLAGAFGYSTMFLTMTIFPSIACIIFLIFGKRMVATSQKIDPIQANELDNQA